ncbi:MAG TPA: HAMP domain-containing sensor histidine kinase, partial [Thermaerobacter sp.]
ARRLGRLVGDLLDLEAVASGRLRLRAIPVDPGALVAEALQDIAPAARKRGIRLDLELEPGIPVVRADRDRLRQALWNLLDNALKHTPPGGRVWVEVRQAAGEVLVTVHDTGSGFDPAEAERIWEPFYRGDRARSRQQVGDGRRGYGLGLATVRWIVEAHGGRVHADGRPGQGASVGFRFPVPARTQPDEHRASTAAGK